MKVVTNTDVLLVATANQDGSYAPLCGILFGLGLFMSLTDLIPIGILFMLFAGSAAILGRRWKLTADKQTRTITIIQTNTLGKGTHKDIIPFDSVTDVIPGTYIPKAHAEPSPVLYDGGYHDMVTIVQIMRRNDTPLYFGAYSRKQYLLVKYYQFFWWDFSRHDLDGAHDIAAALKRLIDIPERSTKEGSLFE